MTSVAHTVPTTVPRFTALLQHHVILSATEDKGEKVMQPVTWSHRRLSVRSLEAGLVLGIATSLLNHAQGLGPVAAVLGSGAAWGAFGLAASLVVAVRYPRVGWLRRAGAVALFYLGACLTYYLTDWLFSIPSTLRLREDVRSGLIPEPRPGDDLSVVPDLGEWLLWSAVSIPAALLVSGTATLLLHRARTDERARDGL